MLTPREVWNADEKETINILESGVLKPLSKNICFYAPTFTYYRTKHYQNKTNIFPTISVTGHTCALNCDHCGGKVLETMHPAQTPEKLFELGLKLKSEGAKGCLVSGGCLPDGSVPLEPFIGTLQRLKRELDLTVFVHTGIIKQETASALKEADVDAALIDVIGSQRTLTQILHLKASVQDYADSLQTMQRAKLPFVPHVIVGLNEGKLDGELHALEIIGETQPSAVVIIAFMPIHGTTMEKAPPPKPLDIAKVTATARLMFPKTPLALGCMRPKGSNRGETDILALKAGMDGVAFPSEEAVEYAKADGYNVAFSPYCCAQMYLDLASRES